MARMSDNFTGGVNAVEGVEGCAFRTQDVVCRSPNVLIALASLSFRPSASFFFGVYSWLVKVLGQVSIIYFRGLGLRIGVRVWVRVRVGVRVWVRVRVSVVLWSG